MRDDVMYGEIPGIEEGAAFADRRALHDADVHRGLVQGIAPGAAAIVLNEGYIDDEDFGDEIIYTGEGGRDLNSGRQIHDQPFTKGNLALAQNQTEGIPVRVTRGPKLKSPYAPSSGYRYDGLYRVERYWPDTGRDGFKIWRYKLIKCNSVTPTLTSSAPEHEIVTGSDSAPKRKRSEVVRVVRDSRVADQVKKLYDYECQACGTTLVTPVAKYAEGCHIRPLGKPHNGKDNLANILCLCANCHVLLDYHALTILDDFTIVETGRKLNVDPRHPIDLANLTYKRKLAPK